MKINERVKRAIRKGKVIKTLDQRDGYKIVHTRAGQPKYVKLTSKEMRDTKLAIKKSVKTKSHKSDAKARKKRGKSNKKRIKLALK